MRSISFFLCGLAVCALVGVGPAGTAQDKKGSKKTPEKKTDPKVPASVIKQLKPWTDRLKEGSAPQVKEHPKGFVKQRNVASDIKQTVAQSDFADKPYVAQIRWTSNRQDSKIFTEKEKAEEAKEWLPPGKVAGSPNGISGAARFTATLYYTGEMWVFEKLEWVHVPPPGALGAPAGGTSSSERGAMHPWLDAIKEVKPK